MRYSQLRAFHAVATAGGFTAAARARHVSQPTLTAQVRGLEREFGVELFVRRGRRFELAEVGRGLLGITRRLADDEAEAQTFLNERREVTDESIATLADLPYLRSLYAVKTPIGDQALRHLQKVPGIEVLYLDDTQVTHDGVRVAAKNPEVRVLELCRTGITDATFAELKRDPGGDVRRDLAQPWCGRAGSSRLSRPPC